jgi:hypothetical protein
MKPPKAKTEKGKRQEKSRKLSNARKARQLADKLFPEEKWIRVEEGIYLSPRRPIGAKTSYKDEIRDAQILRDLGSTIYLVAEDRSAPGKKYDAIVDGGKMEFKNVRSASLLTLEDHFYTARTQAPNMFINLEESPLTKQQIISTLYGARNIQRFTEKDRFNGENGKVVLKIRNHTKLIFLTIDGMKIKQA